MIDDGVAIDLKNRAIITAKVKLDIATNSNPDKP